MRALRKFWSQINTKNESVYDKDYKHWQHYCVSIHIDANGEHTQGLPATLPHVQSACEPDKLCPYITCSNKPMEQEDGLNRFLKALLRSIEDYSVLLLSSGIFTRFTRPEELCSGTPQNTTSSSYIVAIWMGLFAVKTSLVDRTWRRVRSLLERPPMVI